MAELRKNMLDVFIRMPDAENNMLFELKDNRLWIIFNRPKRFNSFTLDMYDKLTKKII